MQRRFRLTRSTDFKRVRNDGKSYAHPLVVLVALPQTGERLQVGVTASRALGGAVQRNRARRRLRECMRPLLPHIQPGSELILIARQPLLDANFETLRAALQTLLRRANLLSSS
ncbi:MAG: hypothetical protein Fur0035_09010 [Anaerolineales bacterium]